MQRWIKLPDGRFVDANRIAYVGKVDTFNRYDEDGNDLGLAYTVNLGTEVSRENHLNVIGTKDEVFGMLRQILGGGSAPPATQA